MLTKEAYFAAYADHRDITPAVEERCEKLVKQVNALLTLAVADGVTLDTNPATGTIVGGEKNGGFRPQTCPIGRPWSAHKTGEAVDLYDRDGDIDAWILKNKKVLEDLDLFMEDPKYTSTEGGRKLHSEGWCHLQIRHTGSGLRVFIP